MQGHTTRDWLVCLYAYAPAYDTYVASTIRDIYVYLRARHACQREFNVNNVDCMLIPSSAGSDEWR